jgi:hypothetical protein
MLVFLEGEGFSPVLLRGEENRAWFPNLRISTGGIIKLRREG